MFLVFYRFKNLVKSVPTYDSEYSSHCACHYSYSALYWINILKA